MSSPILPDAGSAFGARVRARLREEQVIWLTTVGADGTPQPNPVWFLWEDPAGIVVYNRADANRLRHVEHRPQVALHFDGNGRGGDIVVLAGHAQPAHDLPPPHEHAGYLAKYGTAMSRVSGDPEAFSAAYPVALRVLVRRVRGF
jgi:PPOX class probable F420-dependent enzyme